MAPALPILWLGVLTQTQPGPAGHTLLGTCGAGPVPLALWVDATPGPLSAAGQPWDLGLAWMTPAQPPTVTHRTATAPKGWEGIPTWDDFSWTAADDGGTRVWTPEFLAWAEPQPTGSGFSGFNVTLPNGVPCEGAAWMDGPLHAGNSEPLAVLLLPSVNSALGLGARGELWSLPTRAHAIPTPVTKKRRAAVSPLLTPQGPAGDRKVRWERVDVQRVEGNPRPVGRTWRVTFLPSHGAGQVHSTQVSFPKEDLALHVVTGSALWDVTPVPWVGVVLEHLK